MTKFPGRALLGLILVVVAAPVAAQSPFTSVIPGTKTGGSSNIHALGHIPLDANMHTADITIEQELSRPYVYTAHRLTPSGIDIISVKDPAKPKLIYSWRIENADIHQGAGSLNTIYLKSKGRYYLTDAFQFSQGGPDVDLGAIVWDVTGLPDTSKVKELARIRLPEFPGGFHESYGYKHSNGQALLVTTTQGPATYIYDIDKVVAGGDQSGWLVGKIPLPGDLKPGPSDPLSLTGYHDFYVGYDPATRSEERRVGKEC